MENRRLPEATAVLRIIISMDVMLKTISSTKAIENAYRGFLMQHKFPFVSLRMEMEGNDLDVNVHPAKREVRFAREQEVYDAVYDTGTCSALTRREMIPKVSVDSTSAKREIKEEKVTRAAVPEPFEAETP